jgi:hypothetical protein
VSQLDDATSVRVSGIGEDVEVGQQPVTQRVGAERGPIRGSAVKGVQPGCDCGAAASLNPLDRLARAAQVTRRAHTAQDPTWAKLVRTLVDGRHCLAEVVG